MAAVGQCSTSGEEAALDEDCGNVHQVVRNRNEWKKVTLAWKSYDDYNDDDCDGNDADNDILKPNWYISPPCS